MSSAPTVPDPQPPLPPKTTAQEDITTYGQRRINLIWECTQAAVAITVTLAMVSTAFTNNKNDTLTNAFFLIVGFYFSRTNHTQVGGIGPKPNEVYTGR